MNLLPFLLLAMLFTLASPKCNEKKSEKNSSAADSAIIQNNTDTTVKHSMERPPYKPQPRPDSLLFSLKRTACFGTCPAYEYQLYKNGTLFYIGRHYVEKEGIYRTTAGEHVIDLIAIEAQKIDYFNLASYYPEDRRKEITDISYTVTYLHLGSQSKEIVNKKIDAPEELTRFENYADSLLSTVNDWQIVKE